MSREDFPSFIPAEKTIPELTLKAVLVGMILAIIMGSANAYLGLYAGMTVSAAIPGVIMALALLKPFKPTILEVNIGMMGTAAGEALAAGVIFTIPALVVLNRMGLGGWETIHYMETTLIALIGGILGVLWMVPLRRALIVKTELPFPEGIAVAAVETTAIGEGTSKKSSQETSGIWMLIGAALAAIVKFTQTSLNIFRGKVEQVWSVGKYSISGKSSEGFFYGGAAASPALLGVGYIIGFRIAAFVFVGGLLGWFIITPLIILATGMPAGVSSLDGFYSIWGEQVRYIGVGAMVVGGLWTIWRLRRNLTAGVKEAIIGIRGGEVKAKKRTDRDIEYKKVFLAIGFMIIPVFLLYALISSMWALSAFMAILLVMVAFVASAIAGYMAGLLGSSNNPISGVTVAVLLFVSLIMLGAGITGTGGMIIVIGMAAVVCCAAAISGDVLQSMAAGQMIGATPWKQQVAEMVGIIAAAPILALVIQALDKAYGIGSADLPAPQAFLMAGVVKGVIGQEMLWPYVLAGAVLALTLILMDLPVLPVAIGTYLPFNLVVPIFIGGIVRHLVDKKMKSASSENKEEEVSDWELAVKKHGVTAKEKAHRTGLLFTAGLIAGEALMGVIGAFIIIMHIDLKIFDKAPTWPGMLIWGYLAFLIGYIVLREFNKTKAESEKS
jgi:putative OPT family oligopeptide transporter